MEDNFRTASHAPIEIALLFRSIWRLVKVAAAFYIDLNHLLLPFGPWGPVIDPGVIDWVVGFVGAGIGDQRPAPHQSASVGFGFFAGGAWCSRLGR
jgi:hypothetical protein